MNNNNNHYTKEQDFTNIIEEIEENEINIKKYKLSVNEKIDLIDENNQDIYLQIIGGTGETKIYKKMFKSLCSYELIIKLYESCINGLELQSFLHCNLSWFDKLSVKQTIEYSNKILKIEDSFNFGHGSSMIWLEINNINKHNFFNIMKWIKNSLEELHPDLINGFVFMICGCVHNDKTNKKEPFHMDKNFITHFQKIYNEEYIQDENLGIQSKSRQNNKVFNLIKHMKLKKIKVKIYKIPKFILPYCKINFHSDNLYGEYIKIKIESIFYDKFEKINNDIEKKHYSDIIKCKADLFDILQNFNSLIKGLEWNFKSFIEFEY